MSHNWTQIDSQMQQYSAFLDADLGIGPPASNAIATSIAGEINAMPPGLPEQLRKIDPIDPKYRLQEVKAYHCGMQSTSSSNQPAIDRLRMMSTNYITFVYLRGALFETIGKRWARKGSLTRKCCSFFSKDPVWAFRNALAHADWHFKEDYSGIIYGGRKEKNGDRRLEEVSSDKLKFWQSLVLTVGYVVLSELFEPGSSI